MPTPVTSSHVLFEASKDCLYVPILLFFDLIVVVFNSYFTALLAFWVLFIIKNLKLLRDFLVFSFLPPPLPRPAMLVVAREQSVLWES